ncbi:MAG: AAA family ATPase [Parabacteroides distasonis]
MGGSTALGNWTRIYLRKGQDFIWNATNVSRQRPYSVDRLVHYVVGMGCKIVYIEKPYSVWRRQNSTREYEVPETVLDKMLGRLEVPQLTGATRGGLCHVEE